MFVSKLSAKWRSAALVGLLASLALRSVSCSQIPGVHHLRARSLQDEGSSPEALAESWQSRDPDLEIYSEERRAQRYALAVFYYATGGDNWTQFDGWLDYNISECEWFSRADPVCDADGNYLSLHLNSNDLHGNLPTDLGSLTTLNHLNVSQNSLSGLLPSAISKLVALRVLAVGGNDFSGPIPSEFGNLASLRVLSAGSNSISGVFPSDLSKLVSLQDLSVQANNITGGIPDEFGDLLELRNLVVRENSLGSTLPSKVFSLPKLVRLDAEMNTNITGPIPSEIGLASTLAFLVLNENRISSNIPTEIGLAHNLLDILLRNNTLTGFIPSEIGLVTNLGLRRLDLENNLGLTGPIPSEVGAIASLEEFSVEGTAVNINIPPEFCDDVGVVLEGCPAIHATGYMVAWHSRGRGLTVSPDFQPGNYGCQDPAPTMTASCGIGGRISILDFPSNHMCNKTNESTVACEPQGVGHIPLRCDTDRFDMAALVLNVTLSAAPVLSCNGCMNGCDDYGGDAVQRLFIFTNCHYDGLYAMEDSCSGTRRLDKNGNRFCETANGCKIPAVQGPTCNTNLAPVVVSSIGHFETFNGNGCVYTLSELPSVPSDVASMTPSDVPSMTPSISMAPSSGPSITPSDKPSTEPSI